MPLVVHPAAELFPPMSSSEFAELVKDIEKNGQREPILVDLDGRLVDGRNRMRACEKLGIEPKIKRMDCGGPDNTIKLVMSLNMFRRHLDTSQRAMVANDARKLFDAAAKERMKAGGELKGKANLPEASKGQARDQAAAYAHVSPRSVESAGRVAKSGTPEVVAAVRDGHLSRSMAREEEYEAQLIYLDRLIEHDTTKRNAVWMANERLKPLRKLYGNLPEHALLARAAADAAAVIEMELTHA